MVTQGLIDNLAVPDMPTIPGLSFRTFCGEPDYAVMVDIHRASDKADDCDTVYSLKDAAFEVERLANFDPYQDILFVEMDGAGIGYCLGSWVREPGNVGVYYCQGYLAPGWRRRGIGRAMLHWCEGRLSQIAVEWPVNGERVFRCMIAETRRGTIALLESEGYAPAAYFARMRRPDLEDIPEAIGDKLSKWIACQGPIFGQICIPAGQNRGHFRDAQGRPLQWSWGSTRQLACIWSVSPSKTALDKA